MLNLKPRRMPTNELISVTEAKAILEQQSFPRRIVQLPLLHAVGYTVAEDIFSPIDIPSFNQSSMDGYAFAFADLGTVDEFTVKKVLAAGSSERFSVSAGEAVRIFTGAALPQGTDTVIIQEQTMPSGDGVQFLHKDLKQGDNNRLQGSDIKAGQIAMPALSILNEGAIGFLAGLGITKVNVIARPSVALVITGDELQEPGLPLQFGQVYEASSAMLRAALLQMGITNVKVFYARDIMEDTVSAIREALTSSDIVLITGGVSVGDYDFVVRAAQQCSVEQLFHKVRQRPGKPLFAGRRGDQPVFGLPGNPSSVLTCFYQYVWPLLRTLMGSQPSLTTLTVPLTDPYEKKHLLTHFLKGRYQAGVVTILPGQESYRMRSFAVANCLVVLDETARVFAKGEQVTIYLLPVYG